MEPLLALAGAVTTIILPKVFEKASEVVGEKLGNVALTQGSETVEMVRQTVQNKLQTAGTIGLLRRAEEKSTEQNVEMLKGELVAHMEEDQGFVSQLQALIQKIQVQSPSLQVVLDTVRIKGNAEVGNIEQVSESSTAKQIVGRNFGVEGDLKMGDITQKIRKD